MNSENPILPEDDALFPQTTEGADAEKTGEPAAPAAQPEAPTVPQPKVEQPSVVIAAPKEESGFGRFMRSLMRYVTLSLVMLLIGFLAAYFILYNPLNKQLAQTHQQLTDTTSQLDKTTSDYAILKDQYGNLLAQTTLIEAHASLALALRASNLALQGLQDQNGPVARNQVQMARTYLDQFRQYLADNGKQQDAADLDSQMKAVETELVRDPAAATPALDKLLASLESFNELLFVTK